MPKLLGIAKFWQGKFGHKPKMLNILISRRKTNWRPRIFRGREGGREREHSRPRHCENYVNWYIESLCHMYMS